MLPTTEMPPLSTVPKPKTNKKPTQSKNVDIDGSHVFQFVREDIFNSKLFSNEIVYTKADMSKFDNDFQKQLTFNFTQKRASKKKLMGEGCVSRSSAIESLDENNCAFNGESTNFQERSRYALEDIV